MRVVLSFDVEVWCNGWDQLDAVFPGQFERYVYGRSVRGDYALPKTLEILNRHGLRAVFFVEPLFAARFGADYLARIVGLIRAAGQQVELHLHPEWTDELDPAPIVHHGIKRQHLNYYTLDEQTALIAHGKTMLEAAGAGTVSSFRAGSFAANRDTYTALARNGIGLDSSLNAFYPVSGPDMAAGLRQRPASIDGVQSFPVAVFRDGFGRPKPAQIAGCGFAELREAILSAAAAGQGEFIVVSHNFEMLKPASSQPDPVVVRRFEQLCAWLGREQASLPTGTLHDCGPGLASSGRWPQAEASMLATSRRYVEQLLRRF